MKKSDAAAKDTVAHMVERLATQIAHYCRSSPAAFAALEPRTRLCHMHRYVNNAAALVRQLEKILALARQVRGLRKMIKSLERDLAELRCLVAEWRWRCNELN